MWFGFVEFEGATVQLSAVVSRATLASSASSGGPHFQEREALGTLGVAVDDDDYRDDICFRVPGEKLTASTSVGLRSRAF